MNEPVPDRAVPDNVPPEIVPPDNEPPDRVAPFMVPKLDIVGDPLPVMLPVAVNAPIFVAANVLTVSVPLVPESVRVNRVLGTASASFIVKTPFVPSVARVTTGAALERVRGEAAESVSPVAVVAPRPVTDDRVSASVAVRVTDPPSATDAPPVNIPEELIVMDEFVRLVFPILLNVLLAPDMVKPLTVPLPARFPILLKFPVLSSLVVPPV